MSNVSQIGQDLAFISQAVRRRDRRPERFAIYLAWAVYILVGYALLDVEPQYGGAFLTVGWIPAAFATAWARRRAVARGDVADPAEERRAALHWDGGIGLSVLAGLGLASVMPALQGPASGQVIVLLIGVVYFLGGVHFDRRFLVLGPLMMLGAVLLPAIPAWPWTTLGVVIAAGLVAPSLFKRGRDAGQN